MGPGSKVLDVGAGTGILCAGYYELAKNADTSTKVVGIEHMQGLCEAAVHNLNKSYSNQIQSGEIKIVCGDGREGYLPEAPYDIINVGAGCQ